jgi:dephospho-CoA kinase
MKFWGIIGGIGSGKSTVAAEFCRFGAAVIDADKIGHQVLLLPKIKNAVRERWDSAVFDANGEINRQKLAAVVFAEEKQLTYLKTLTYPAIAEEVHRQREKYERIGIPLCLFDAPLLLESGWKHLTDLIIFVDSPEDVRWNRVKSRGWSIEEWKQREASQFSLDEKRRQADVIIDNSGGFNDLEMQIKKIIGNPVRPTTGIKTHLSVRSRYRL